MRSFFPFRCGIKSGESQNVSIVQGDALQSMHVKTRSVSILCHFDKRNKKKGHTSQASLLYAIFVECPVALAFLLSLIGDSRLHLLLSRPVSLQERHIY